CSTTTTGGTSSASPQLWAAFNLGLLSGILLFLRTPTVLLETIPVEMLVRDDSGGSVGRDMAEIRFVEDGRILGRIEGAAFLLGGRADSVAEKICGIDEGELSIGETCSREERVVMTNGGMEGWSWTAG